MARKTTYRAVNSIDEVREALRKAFKGRKAELEEELCRLYSEAVTHERRQDGGRALGFVEEAIGLLQKDGSVPDTAWSFTFYKAKLLFDSDRNEEALETFDSILRADPGNVHALYFKAKTLSCLKRNSEAFGLFRKAYEMDSGDPCCVAGMAIVLSLEGEGEKALALLESIDPGKGWRNEILETKAAALFLLERYKEALAALDEIAIDRPNDGGTHFSRALTLGALGRRQEELAAIDRAVELKPANVQYRIQRALCLVSLGRSDDAAAAFRSIGSKRLFPHLAVQMREIIEMGNCRRSLGRLQEFLTLDPKSPDLGFFMGIALIGAGKPVDGRACLYSSLARFWMDGKDGQATEALEAFASAFNARGESGPAKEIARAARAATPGSEGHRILEAYVRRFREGEMEKEAAKRSADSEMEKARKSAERANGRLAEAKAGLGAAEEKLKRLEGEIAGAEPLAEALGAKASAQQLILAREHGILSESEAKRRLEKARSECRRLGDAQRELSRKIEACDHAVQVYMGEHGIIEKDDSLLLAHIRTHTRRGAQREKLEKSVDQRRQMKSQAVVLKQQVTETEAQRKGLEQALSPFFELASARGEARERALQLAQQADALRKEIESLSNKISSLEARANGNGANTIS